ncbi:MAG TPA: NADPH:quinone oxidoreductase family protein [Steroidobacteraceae bacterium]|nr:NADPH:quinone oxidoreductase family protein [Steroidobacteraceae bacterium]
MRALICDDVGSIEALRVQDRPSPVPGARQILIDVKATSVNFPDALMVLGKYQVKPPPPFSPGCELAGIVAAVGPDVGRFCVGDRVTAIVPFGAMAEEVVVDADAVLPILAAMDFVTAAGFVLTYGTSYHALVDRAKLSANETLLVLGAAGGVGLAAVELGKAIGAHVIAAASSAAKLELCREHGADHLIDYGTQNLRERIQECTNRCGVDVVFDPVGGAYSEPALRSLRFGGRLLVVGFAAGEIPKLPLNLALLGERSILGVLWGEWTRRDPGGYSRNQRVLGEWYRAGRLRPAITERVDLAGAIGALKRMVDRQVSGKIIVLPEL